jgi:hypothetical protein
MDLDMYAYTTTRKLKQGKDFRRLEHDELLHQWRKRPNLHGWMEQLYRAKGGEREFNCTNVALTSVDLDRLECVIRESKLPETCGVFFRQSDGSEEGDDIAFIAKARAAIADGRSVYYRSWW